jgi:hypothetical protein
MSKFNKFSAPPVEDRDQDKPQVVSQGACEICGDEILRPYISQQDEEDGKAPEIPDRGFHKEIDGKQYHADCWFGQKTKPARKVAA